jgi:hypothetical protein
MLGFALVCAACAGTQKTPLTVTPQAPAAEGTVETRRTENKNTEVNLRVEHMAPPEKIVNDATVYVVWAQPLAPGAEPQNMGSFVVGKDRKGQLKTVTPQEQFELIVTPEAKGTVEKPTNEPVLKAKIPR